MLPAEMVILMAIAMTGDSGERLLTRPVDVYGEYIGSLYDSLVERGYLEENDSDGYQLTWKGMVDLVEFLLQNKAIVEDTVNALKQLGIRKSREIDKLAAEVLKVR